MMRSRGLGSSSSAGTHQLHQCPEQLPALPVKPEGHIWWERARDAKGLHDNITLWGCRAFCPCFCSTRDPNCSGHLLGAPPCAPAPSQHWANKCVLGVSLFLLGDPGAGLEGPLCWVLVFCAGMMDSCAWRSGFHLQFAGSTHMALLGSWRATAALGLWLTNLALLWSSRKHLTLLEEGRWENRVSLAVLCKQSAMGCAGTVLLAWAEGGKEQDWVLLLRHGSALGLCNGEKGGMLIQGVRRMSSRLQFGSGKGEDLGDTGNMLANHRVAGEFVAE